MDAVRVCLWWLQSLPRTPYPPPALSQATRFLSRVGSPDAKPGMPVMRGGLGGGRCATRGGARERADAVLSSPEHCGQRAERGSGLERLQPGTRHEEPAHRRPRLQVGAIPHRGQMGKLRLPGASESQGLSRT